MAPARRASSLIALALLLVAAGCDAGASDPCSPAALAGALEAAAPGSVVELGACEVEGSFLVPEGVTLRGRGAASTTLTGGQVLVLARDAAVQDLSVETTGPYGIVGVGGGSATVERVWVSARRGAVAVGFDGRDRVTLRELTVEGPVDARNAADLPPEPSEEDTALFGVVLSEVADAQLTEVQVRGFGYCGVAQNGGAMRWVGGGVEESLGFGIWLQGGEASLHALSVEAIFAGSRLDPGFGIASADADVTTNAVSVRGSEGGFGVIHLGGEVLHEGLLADANPAGAMLAQETRAFTMRHSDLRDNAFASLIAIRARGILVEDSRLEGTRAARGAFGLGGHATLGDGLHLVAPEGVTLLRRVELLSNERSGAVIDLGGASTARLVLESVRATASGRGFGVVAQNGALLDRWDEGVDRDEVAAANDLGRNEALPIAGLVAPTNLPPSSLFRGLVAPTN